MKVLLKEADKLCRLLFLKILMHHYGQKCVSTCLSGAIWEGQTQLNNEFRNVTPKKGIKNMKANKKVSEITAWNKIHWKEIIIQTTVENSMMSWLEPRSSSSKIMQGTLFSDVWFLLKGDNSDSSKSISLTLRTSYNFWKSYKVCLYRNPLRSSSDNIYGCLIKLWIQATYFQRLVFNLGK